MLPRVGFVLGSFNIGGAERQTIALAQALQLDCFAPFLIVIRRAGPIFAELQKSNSSIEVLCLDGERGFDWRAMKRMASCIDNNSLDIVVAANQYATIFLRFAMFFSKRKPAIVSAFHSSPEHIDDSLKAKLQLALYGWALAAVAATVFVSENQRSAWLAKNFLRGRKSKVIHNGIDVGAIEAQTEIIDRATIGWAATDFVVGLCAQMRVEKCIPDLISAAKILHARGLPIRILLIGDGIERPSIEAKIAAEMPTGMVHITGLQQAVVPWLRMCDVVTLVSKAEAFSMVSLEAMACRKALVLSNVGGASEQVDDGITGYLFEAGRTDQLVERIQEIFDLKLAKKMGEDGFVKVSRSFPFQKMVDSYCSLFKSLIH